MRIYPIKIRNKWNEWHTSVLIFVFFLPFEPTETRKLLCKLNWAHVPVTNSHVRPATCQHKVIFVLLNYSQCKLMRCLGLSCFHKRNSQIICVICFGDFFGAYFMAVVDFRYLLNDRFVYERNILLI